MVLQSLIYEFKEQEVGDGTILKKKPTLQVLDQLLLPDSKVYIDVTDIQTTWSVIRNMQIRGAPLIAVVACLGLVVDLYNETSAKELRAILQMNSAAPAAAAGGVSSGAAHAVLAYIQGKMDYLATSRPTAVNLFNALTELKLELQTQTQLLLLQNNSNESSSWLEQVRDVVRRYAEFALERDGNDCRAIGRHGAEELLRSKNKNNKLTVMTICNTGSLATSSYGTALGVIRALQERDCLQKCVALETRPYNQGSRLTAFEMVEDGLQNATLICDGMAAAFMQQQQQQAAAVDAVVVGADRICANGDTANKIGTYSLALVAHAHGVPFYVAAPFTTLDVSLATGADIPIEQRPAEEVISTSRAPKEGLAVWNPAFDVTPARYLSGIITEKGVIYPTTTTKEGGDGATATIIDVAAFVKKHSSSPSSSASSPPSSASAEGGIGEGADTLKSKKEEVVAKSLDDNKTNIIGSYVQQHPDTLPHYLAEHAPRVMEILQATSPQELNCVEFGDGNLNLVFVVTNKNTSATSPNEQQPKQVIVKQALPYVRCVGESWPLTLERAYFEHEALAMEYECCSGRYVPQVYHFSKTHGLMVMEYLAPPIFILRKGLIKGIKYPTMAVDMGTFCACTLFKTSGFKLNATELRARVEFWSRNREMCQLTEAVVFTEPYVTHSNNRWTTPQLDGDKRVIETDTELKIAAAQWKHKFVTDTVALIHGDLHSGSVMCAPEPQKTFAIDPEFAYYGPMGFDTGAFIANLFLSYTSQPGHRAHGDDEYGEWVLSQVKTFWETFVQEFLKLWNDPSEHTGYWYSHVTLNSSDDALLMQQCQANFVRGLLAETLGFCGMKMLRRVVGIAHVEDLESIQDVEIKAACERHALEAAKVFIKNAATFASIDEAIQLVRDKKK